MQVGPPQLPGQPVRTPPGPSPGVLGTVEPPPPPPPPTGPGRPGGGSPSPWPAVAAVVVGLWAVAVTVGAQGIGWLIDQVLLGAGRARPGWLWPLTAAVDALLVGLPAGLLAALPRSRAIRTAGRAWLLGAATLGAFGLLRAIPMPHNELYLAALAGAAALVAAVAGRLRGRRLRGFGRPGRALRMPGPRLPGPRIPGPRGFGLPGRGPAAEPAAVGLAVCAGLALLLPWLWFGALGGLLETVLALAAAAAVGWLAATILDGPFWTAYEWRAGGELAGGPRVVLLGGLVAGVALMLLAAGVGQSGAQLAAMLVLPPAGFAVAALRRVSRLANRGFGPDRSSPDAGRSRPVGWLVAIATAGPLAFVDPEEISLLLVNGRDVPFWAVVAAGTSLGVALLLGIGYGIAFARTHARIPHRRVAAVAAAAVLLAAGGVYVGLGHPGLYGERLFVVLKQQADLGGIPAGPPGLAGRDARAREVYHRLVATADASQAALRRDLDRLHLRYTPYYLVNAIEVDGGPAVRAWLSRHDGVARVLLSQRLRPLPGAPPAANEDTVPPGGPPAPTAPQWNLTMIGADRVWSQLGVDGAGIVVGGSDSGVDGRHPALASGFRGGNDSWYDPWNGTRVPTDHGGHGTHTLATAVGRNGVGVARGARWVGCVNLDRNLGNPAHYLDCLQFMLAPFPTGGSPFTDGRPERAPQVLTNSWGCPPIEGCDRDLLRPATAALAAAGIFVVAAAGNTGPYCGSAEDPPAPYPDVMTVGAVDRQGLVTRFSSRGPAPGGVVKPDVVAPGAGVLSAMPGGGYATLDGTSMATPHVAGVVALMWSANPALVGDLARTRSILRDTAVPADLSGLPDSPSAGCGRDANIEGAGLVDAYAAVQAAKRAAGQGG